jgi:hypothetical protein
LNLANAISSVTGGLSLVAFVVAAFFYAYRANLKNRLGLILAAPPKDRRRAIEQTAAFLKIDTSTLSGAAKERLILEQLKIRANRDKMVFYAAILIASMLAIIAIITIIRQDNPPQKISERDVIQRLTDDICNRGVLENDYSWELPNEVYASVGEIENELGNALGQLATDSEARQPLQTMRSASRKLLQDPTVFPNGPGGGARPISDPLRDAIHKFRMVFSQNTAQLVQIYALKGNCNLSGGLEAVPSR